MILVCGEALIDFIPTADGAYMPVPGGSSRNIATALGRLGADVGFMGGLSTDVFGDMIARRFQEDGVSLDYAPRLEAPSTLAFVQIGAGEPAYAFYDEPSAHRAWTRASSPPPGAEVNALHVGSLSLIAPSLADEILALLREQKGRRVLSIDPNCRPSLTHDVAAYRARLATMVALADIIKLSAADLEFAYPGAAPETQAASWLAGGAALVILTLGDEGAVAWMRDGTMRVPAPAIVPVDTVGAGDSFIAAALFALGRDGLLSTARLADLTIGQARAALTFAARASAITCSRVGADPPWLCELEPTAS